MKRPMFLTLVGLGVLTLCTGVVLAATDAADWVSRVHVAGAGAFTLLMIAHVWGRRKTVGRAARGRA